MAETEPPPQVVDDDEPPSLVSDDDEDMSSVTTESVLDAIMPRRFPAVSIRAQVNLDLPAWFIVLTSYIISLGLGIWTSKETGCIRPPVAF
jgi:hypothetical protein